MKIIDFDIRNAKKCFGSPLLLEIASTSPCRSCVDRDKCIVMAYETLNAIGSGRLAAPHIAAHRIHSISMHIGPALPRWYASRTTSFSEQEIARISECIRRSTSTATVESTAADSSELDDLLGTLDAQDTSIETAPPTPADATMNVISVAPSIEGKDLVLTIPDSSDGAEISLSVTVPATPARSALVERVVAECKVSEDDDEAEDEDREYGEEELHELNALEYAFPPEAYEKRWPDYEAMTVQQLAEALNGLSAEEVTKGRPAPYGGNRLCICAISVELNRRGKLAPRFRTMRRPPQQVSTVGGQNLGRDRQVIDFHWLHCTRWKETIHIRSPHLRDLFERIHFKWARAEEFAVLAESADEKAMCLGLPDSIAFQLAAIQENRIREAFRVAEMGEYRHGKLTRPGRKQVIQILRTSVVGNRRLQSYVPSWAMLWTCSQLAGEQGELLRQFHALALGLDKPLDRRGIERKLETINGHISKSSGAKPAP